MFTRAAQDCNSYITHVDATRVDFYANTIWDIFVKLPSAGMELGEEQRCGKLHKAAYRARGAAQNWKRRCCETVRQMGFMVVTASPCHFLLCAWR